MTCQTCQHWSPKRALGMSKHSYGLCVKSFREATCTAPQHQCQRHQAANAEVVQKRVVWLNKEK